jgi:hypothetical protein
VKEPASVGRLTGRRELWLVVLLYAAMATAIGHVDYHIRSSPEHGFAKYSPGVIAGTEGPPGRYRVLAPYAYDSLRAVTGLVPRDAWIVFRWLSVLGALVAGHVYFRTWFSAGPAIAGVLLMAVLLPLTFTNGWAHPDHLVELALFTLACATIARGWTVAFAIVLVLNGLNRETSVFLVPLFLLSARLSREHLEKAGVLALVWAATYVGLRSWLGFQTYDPWQFGRNLQFLALLPADYDLYYRAYAWFVVVMALPLAYAAWLTWRKLPRMVRAATGVVAPLFVLTSLLFSSVIETRIFTPLLPLLAPPMLFALFKDDAGTGPTGGSSETNRGIHS